MLFDDWAGAALPALEVSILSSLPMGVVMQAEHHRLADLLAELCDRLDARFLIVLDAFERLWSGPDARTDATEEFVDQLSEAVNRADLNANFLISIDESAASRLEGLRHRILGFDDSTLWLHAPPPPKIDQEAGEGSAPPTSPPPGGVLPVLPLVDSVPVAVRPEKVRRKRPPRQPLPLPAPIKTETVYAFIESTLTQTADASEPWRGMGEMSALSRRVAAGSADVLSLPDRSIGAPLGGAMSPRPQRTFGPDDDAFALNEPPSPIDQWLDAATSWWRRLWRRQ